MKKIFLLLAGIFLFAGEIFSSEAIAKERLQGDTASQFMSRLNFSPLLANPLEARIGVQYQSDKKLRLDIGNSLDLIDLGKELSIGTDFFVLTRLRSEGNFKFPVETSDYFFGLNVSSAPKKYFSDNVTNSFRLRVAHISSHVVDGLADTSGLLYKRPFVYSREFAELIGTMEFWQDFRIYAGLTYVWATQPRNPNRSIPQFGIEYRGPRSKSQIFAAYDFKLTGIKDVYSGVHSWQAGYILGADFGTALMLSFYGYQGRSVHGMFYNEHDSYLGFGFQVLY